MNWLKEKLYQFLNIKTLVIEDRPVPDSDEAKYWHNAYHSILRELAKRDAKRAIRIGYKYRRRTIRFRNMGTKQSGRKAT